MSTISVFGTAVVLHVSVALDVLGAAGAIVDDGELVPGVTVVLG
jgi:hypothetical protein